MRTQALTPYSPNTVRIVNSIQQDRETLEYLSNDLSITQEEIEDKLTHLQDEYLLENEGLVILLQATGGDVELSVTMLAHLMDKSPSELYARHVNELSKGHRIDMSKSKFIRDLASMQGDYRRSSTTVQDLSYLLGIDNETVINKLNNLADKIEMEENTIFTIRGASTSPSTQAAIVAHLCGSNILDLKVTHSELFPNIVVEEYIPQPQPQPLPQRKAVATATLVR